MQKIMVMSLLFILVSLASCEKDKLTDSDMYGDGPSGNVGASMQGSWMYGFFSMTEYWSQNPSEYLGNGFEMAMAFKFNAKGTYDHYFTSKTVSNGITTYRQSLTKGTVVVNENNKTITTHAKTAHYKQMKNGVVTEERDLSESEITKTTTYTFEMGTEPNGTPAIYLKLNGAGNALQFLKKF